MLLKGTKVVCICRAIRSRCSINYCMELEQRSWVDHIDLTEARQKIQAFQREEGLGSEVRWRVPILSRGENTRPSSLAHIAMGNGGLVL